MASNSASRSGSTDRRFPFASSRQSASSGSSRSSSRETKGSARTGATVTQSQRGSSGLLAASKYLLFGSNCVGSGSAVLTILQMPATPGGFAFEW